MNGSLDIFRMAGAMARNAGARQAMIASNVANADTPGYSARHLRPFSEIYGDTANVTARVTRPGHVDAGAAPAGRSDPSDAEPSPDGNTVSIETEMLEAVRAQGEHTRALAIYRHALGVLRTSLGGGR